jgi:DNA-binding NarL/FixJ family response regulator
MTCGECNSTETACERHQGRFIGSILGKCPYLQIIGEVSDELEAVRRAEEQQPALVLLDIGLPSLNGLAAEARQIPALSPESKIIFVNQESDPDVVREALNLGACGYVVKTSAAIDLIHAPEAAGTDHHLGGELRLVEWLSDGHDGQDIKANC